MHLETPAGIGRTLSGEPVCIRAGGHDIDSRWWLREWNRPHPDEPFANIIFPLPAFVERTLHPVYCSPGRRKRNREKGGLRPPFSVRFETPAVLGL